LKRIALFLLASIGLASIAIEPANAGSAVALGPHNQLDAAYGGPVAREKERALAAAHRRYGSGPFRILASTDLTGYCAIATARHPNGNIVIGVALGRRSPTEADTLAIEQCLKAGGVNPQVKSAFRG
jgi:hypothetical protein